MARRILNRKDLRADFDAAERSKQEDNELDENEEEVEDEAEDEEEAEADDEGAEVADEDQEEPVAKKSKPAEKKVKTKTRSRAAKIARMKVVWGVFNNSNQRVATFEYPKRKEAHDLATKLTADKKTTHFVQPVKEPWEEKKGD